MSSKKTTSIDAAKTSGTSPSLQPRGLRIEAVPLPARRGLRIKDAAAYLGVSPWWMEVAIREKRLPAYKFNTNYYVIFKDDLDAYIDRLRSAGAA